MTRAALALALALAACTGDDAVTTDAQLQSCEGVCPPLAFCTSGGVCSCTVDGATVQCQRPPPGGDGGVDGQ